MNTFDTIKKSEFEIWKMTDELRSERTKDKAKLETLVRKLEFKQENSIRNFLETSHNIYQTLVKENFDLLTNDHIEFSIMSEEEKIFKSHAIRYDGQLNDDGVFSCTATENAVIFFTFLRGFYPLRYKGLINYFGKAHVRIDQSGYRLFGVGSKMPAKFAGSIDKTGNMVFRTTETYTDGGHYNTEKSINNITADLFSGDEHKRHTFLDNKRKLKKVIEDFRNNFTPNKFYGKRESEKRAQDDLDDYRKEYGY